MKRAVLIFLIALTASPVAIPLAASGSGNRALQQQNDDMVTVHGGTASYLLPYCEAALRLSDTRLLNPVPTRIQEALNAEYCQGYVLGVVDSLIFTTEKKTYCIPSHADTNQFVRIVVKYMNDNPAELSNAAYEVVGLSMIKAFPCT